MREGRWDEIAWDEHEMMIVERGLRACNFLVSCDSVMRLMHVREG